MLLNIYFNQTSVTPSPKSIPDLSALSQLTSAMSLLAALYLFLFSSDVHLTLGISNVSFLRTCSIHIFFFYLVLYGNCLSYFVQIFAADIVWPIYLKDPTEASCLEGLLFFSGGICHLLGLNHIGGLPIIFVLNVLILVWVLILDDLQMFRRWAKCAVLLFCVGHLW